MSKTYKTQEGWFFVDIEKPTQKQIDSYYNETGEMKSSSNSNNAPRVFKKAIILHTFDEENYPIESTWIMGETEGMKINFFGEKLIAIQEKDLYARIS